MFGAWIAGLITGACVLLLVTVRLEVAYRRVDNHDYLWLEISLPANWGAWKLEITPLELWWQPFLNLGSLSQKDREKDKKPEKIDPSQPWRGLYTIGRAIRIIVTGRWRYWVGAAWVRLRIWQQFLARISCRRWRLFISLGTGEPASTAILYGSTWLLLSRLYRNLLRRAQLDFKRPDLDVRAQFNAAGWQADFNCIFYLRLGHIISAGLRFLWLIIITLWQTRGSKNNARTSYRKLDEDGNGKHQGYG